jgi:hypothetical protein
VRTSVQPVCPGRVESGFADDGVNAPCSAVALTMAEPQHRRDAEFRVPGERLRVDGEPRLPVAGQHVAIVQVGVDEQAPGARPQLPGGIGGRVEQPPTGSTAPRPRHAVSAGTSNATSSAGLQSFST